MQNIAVTGKFAINRIFHEIRRALQISCKKRKLRKPLFYFVFCSPISLCFPFVMYVVCVQKQKTYKSMEVQKLVLKHIILRARLF